MGGPLADEVVCGPPLGSGMVMRDVAACFRVLEDERRFVQTNLRRLVLSSRKVKYCARFLKKF